MRKYNRDNFKISFGDKSELYYYDYNNGVVVCKLTGTLLCPFPIKDWSKPYIECQKFTVTGKAVCSKDDDFDIHIGQKIALAKAENAIYNKACSYLIKAYEEHWELINSMSEFFDKADGVIEHNISYIKELS